MVTFSVSLSENYEHLQEFHEITESEIQVFLISKAEFMVLFARLWALQDLRFSQLWMLRGHRLLTAMYKPIHTLANILR